MATLADVAQRAGVAPSTVSYVLSGRRSISTSTTERVEAAIRELGYHPHAGARALASNRSDVLALVLPLRAGMNMPVLMRFVTSVVTTAREFGQDVLLVTADQGAEGLRRVAGSAQVDGLLVMDIEMDDERVPVLRDLSRPSVLIGYPADAQGLTCIDLDFEAAGAACVEHLADLGHHNIGFLGAPSVVYQRNTGFAQRTMAGFSAGAMRRGVASTALPIDTDYETVVRITKQLLDQQPAMTALVVHNEAALGWIITGLRTLGRRVPEDIAVVAICPDELAEQMSPPVTSVQLPAEELGSRAVRLLMAKLAHAESPPLTLLEPQLVERASTEPRVL